AITSKRSRSIAARMPPAVTHEMPCSPLRPPNRRATVVLIRRGYSLRPDRARQQGRGDLVDPRTMVHDGDDGARDRHVHPEPGGEVRDRPRGGDALGRLPHRRGRGGDVEPPPEGEAEAMVAAQRG